jgi:cytoskeleton protein RodZ
MMEYDQLKGAAKVGAGLREVRERLGWRIADVAAALRIRLPYLEAIERGDLAALPGAAYQTGFVRSYAQILGLDAEEILRRFRAEGMGVTTKAELSFLAPVPDRAVPTGAIVLVGVFVVLIGYGLWYFSTAPERNLANAVPSVPAELAPLALPPKPPAPPVKTAQVKPERAPVKTPASPGPVTTATVAAATPATAPMPTTAPTTAAPPVVKAAPSAASTAAGTQPATPTAAPAATASATQTSAPATGQIVVATADDWVEVRDATGNIVFSKVLHAGDRWPVPQEAGLTMTAGNAGGTTGTVLHGYRLTPPAPSATATK